MKNKITNKLIIFAVAAIAIIALVIAIIVGYNTTAHADEITIEQAQQMIDETFDGMLDSVTRKTLAYIASCNSVVAKSLSYGENRDITVDCEITTIDVSTPIIENLSTLLDIDIIDENGIYMTSTKIKYLIDDNLTELLKNAEQKQINTQITIYQTKDGYVVYTPTELVDAYYGGIFTVKSTIDSMSTIVINGTEKRFENNLKNGLNECIKVRYEDDIPETVTGIAKLINKFVKSFKLNFIDDNNWKYITNGLLITFEITILSAIMGIILGFIIAIIRCTADKTGKLKFLNSLCNLYLTVVRGTPVLVQLLIIYFVIFLPIGIEKVPTAIICFGINSGAYVAEIVRGGIMSVDEGQFEAGRSLGFNYIKTMWYIILPQALKSVLPSLANEFIALIKETSVSAYIGINDLARGGDIIRGNTFSAFMPLIAVALIYLVIVVGFSKLVSLLERRLRKSEK